MNIKLFWLKIVGLSEQFSHIYYLYQNDEGLTNECPK